MKKYIRKCYFYGAYIFSKLVLVLPYKFAVGKLAEFLGAAAYYLVADARKRARKNLTLCFPEKSKDEIECIIKKIFKYQAKNFFELLNFPKMDKSFFHSVASMSQKDIEIYKKALSKNKGLLIASAHFGNWEMLASGVAAENFPVNVIAKRIYIEELNQMLVSYRSSKNVNVILRSERDTARKMLKALKNNEIIAMLIDQDTSVQSVFVDFFGMPASTPSGLATIALKTGTPVIMTVSKRLPGDTHVFIVSEEIEPDKTTDNFEQDVINFTAKVTKYIEKCIKENPEQWVWFHERWKTKKV